MFNKCRVETQLHFSEASCITIIKAFETNQNQNSLLVHEHVKKNNNNKQQTNKPVSYSNRLIKSWD